MKSKPLFPAQPVTQSGLPPSQELVEIIQRIVGDLIEMDGDLTPFTDLLDVANSGRHFRVSAAGGVELAPSIFQLPDQVITLTGALGPFAHGLGGVPLIVTAAFVCQTAELGFSVGDVVPVSPAGQQSITIDATNINIRFSSAATNIAHKTTGVQTFITPARWHLRVVAQL